ncbi:peptidylprolyl isomerase [Adhaeribacter sp. BT258]|uniref:Peptidyl-prolyl cis-trans isomerase n=1 Tax=Adhaeribacter terrigena TaxID=2793070 RepID=A0ABS1BWM2_9BACT|nr:peptidylprolyl isomerase [Adhaeribacter terrigena]MBK0401524.1 peptidylprolyl isomerase [Adhaeribacter terrigena]
MLLFKRFTLPFLLVLLTVSVGFAQKKKKTSKKDDVVTITTPQGEMKLVLFEETPLHKANFLKLAKEGFYDGSTFHRVIENFMIQGGDPNSKNESPNDDGMGNNGYMIPAEFKPELKHVKGALAAARTENPKKESSGCQFYIVQNEFGTPFLDGNYTVFGQTISGLEVIDAIAKQPKDFRDRPLTDVKMTVKVETMKKKDITKKYGYVYPGAEVKVKEDKKEKKEKIKA